MAGRTGLYLVCIHSVPVLLRHSRRGNARRPQQKSYYTLLSTQLLRARRHQVLARGVTAVFVSARSTEERERGILDIEIRDRLASYIAVSRKTQQDVPREDLL